MDYTAYEITLYFLFTIFLPEKCVGFAHVFSTVHNWESQYGRQPTAIGRWKREHSPCLVPPSVTTLQFWESKNNVLEKRGVRNNTLLKK